MRASRQPHRPAPIVHTHTNTRAAHTGNMMLARLRGICMRHHDLFVRNMPNVWFAIAKLLADYLVGLHLFALSFSE